MYPTIVVDGSIYYDRNSSYFLFPIVDTFFIGSCFIGGFYTHAILWLEIKMQEKQTIANIQK